LRLGELFLRHLEIPKVRLTEVGPPEVGIREVRALDERSRQVGALQSRDAAAGEPWLQTEQAVRDSSVPAPRSIDTTQACSAVQDDGEQVCFQQEDPAELTSDELADADAGAAELVDEMGPDVASDGSTLTTQQYVSLTSDPTVTTAGSQADLQASPDDLTPAGDASGFAPMAAQSQPTTRTQACHDSARTGDPVAYSRFRSCMVSAGILIWVHWKDNVPVPVGATHYTFIQIVASLADIPSWVVSVHIRRGTWEGVGWRGVTISLTGAHSSDIFQFSPPGALTFPMLGGDGVLSATRSAVFDDFSGSVVHYPAMSFRAHFDLAPVYYVDSNGSLPGPAELRCDSLPYLSGSGCVQYDYVPTLTYHVSDPRYGQSAQFHYDAQSSLSDHIGRVGYTPLLRYYSPTTARRARYRACKGLVVPTGKSCDEYPFASTYQNALRHAFKRRAVSAEQNSATGRALSAFYRQNRLRSFDRFWLRVLP
jgi:hypothetical protein